MVEWLRLARQVVAAGDNLRRTISIAALIGTVLFAVNQLDIVIGGDATTKTWVKSGLTYLVPFITANLGIMHAVRTYQGATPTQAGQLEHDLDRAEAEPSSAC